MLAWQLVVCPVRWQRFSATHELVLLVFSFPSSLARSPVICLGRVTDEIVDIINEPCSTCYYCMHAASVALCIMYMGHLYTTTYLSVDYIRI
jgi:hypothetical protein